MRSLAVRGMEMMRIGVAAVHIAVGHIAVATGTGRQNRRYHSSPTLTLWFLFYQKTSQIGIEIMWSYVRILNSVKWMKEKKEEEKKPFDFLNLIEWRCDDVWLSLDCIPVDRLEFI